MQDKRLLILFLIVFIDLLGFSLILPLLPFYAETFGATPFQIGLLVASYAAAQLIGAPLLGRMSDRFGRRPVLFISLIGTFIGFLMLGFANSLWMLFASRLLDGFTGGNISVAQAYITDVTDESNRAKGLGLLGAAFGLGFIIGPALGGILSVYGFALPAFVAAGLSLISILGVVFFLPESLTEAARADIANQERQKFSIENLWRAINRPRVGPILNVRSSWTHIKCTLLLWFGVRHFSNYIPPLRTISIRIRCPEHRFCAHLCWYISCFRARISRWLDGFSFR
jgi:DHA1 family tetracycline resistance protein-like MFS transporter